MHTCQLGIGLHLNGSVLRELLDADIFPGASASERFTKAFAHFRQWTRQHGISCSQSCFKPYMLVSKSGEEFCYFQTKDAWQLQHFRQDSLGIV